MIGGSGYINFNKAKAPENYFDIDKKPDIEQVASKTNTDQARLLAKVDPNLELNNNFLSILDQSQPDQEELAKLINNAVQNKVNLNELSDEVLAKFVVKASTDNIHLAVDKGLDPDLQINPQGRYYHQSLENIALRAEAFDNLSALNNRSKLNKALAEFVENEKS